MRGRRTARGFPRGRRAAVLLLLLASCGEESRHGLEAPALLPSKPGGEPLEVGRGLAPSSWLADVTVKVEDLMREREGVVSLEIRQDVEPLEEAGRLRSTVRFDVVASSGQHRGLLAGIKELDGVEATFEHGRHGERIAGTLAFSSQAAPEAEEVLERLWLCGYGGGPSWVPARPVRVGETWPREELAGTDPQAKLQVIEQGDEADLPAVRRSGGVHLEALRQEEGARRRLVLRLATFQEIEGRMRQGGSHMTMSYGQRAEGVGVIDEADGLPVSWQLHQRMRLDVEGHPEGAIDARLTVRGARRPAPPRDR